jgi:hypothetical protein
MSRARRGIVAALAVGVLLAGCGDPEPRPVSQRPFGFQPERFPDIALPRSGYMYSPGEEQLAVAFAGGTVRRFEVAMERREGLADQTPAELLAQLSRDLEQRGWALTVPGEQRQHWRKGGEELVLETGRADSRTTIRYRLRPASQPPR